MSARMPAVWQVSGLTANRSFVDVFLHNGVVLTGPGDPGPWHLSRDDADFDGPLVRRLAAEMQPGDIILLRTAPATVHTVGIVVGDYSYLPQFDEVNGWDLQHARRVRWCDAVFPYTFPENVFGSNPPRLSLVTAPGAVEYARQVVQSPPTRWQHLPLPPLPVEEPLLDEPPAPLTALIGQALDLAQMYADLVRFGEPPAEHEMVSHFVAPLLATLRWPPELVALEWRRIDVAVFDRLPRAPANCRFILEAKRLGVGVEGHLQQGIDYLAGLGIKRDVIVTDGFRYRLYAADQNYAPVAYANLIRLKVSSQKLFERIQRP